jgi:hypothetical protein
MFHVLKYCHFFADFKDEQQHDLYNIRVGRNWKKSRGLGQADICCQWQGSNFGLKP